MENILWSIGHDLKLKNITHAKGCFIYDTEGKSYLDMESGVWCTPLGHCHPKIHQALTHQMKNIMHTGYCYAHPIIQDAAKSVLEITGFPEGKCLFLTSGSEAVEVGVKTIKMLSSKPLLLTFSDSFLGSLGSSGTKPDSEWFQFDWSKCAVCPTKADCDTGCPHFSTIPFENISGFVFEPGSSSGMVRFPPETLIIAIARRIQKDNGFIQINEITTGMGRTGKWFGYMHYDITPDIVSMGKGLGNGYPVSVIAFNKNILYKMEEKGFYHSQSHQNDPLGCVAANAVIQTMKKEKALEKCISNSSYLMEKLMALKQKFSAIKDIRGRGLMMAMEFSETISHDTVVFIYEKILEKGFIIAKRPKLKIFRIDPPLIIERKMMDDFVQAMDDILSEL